MSSGFANPISIIEAIENIDSNKYLLPAIQRKFVWGSDKVEELFDSIMRGYPINSFMFWEVKEKSIKNGFKFYEFIKEYRQFFKEENTYMNTLGYSDFFAVIDGQQRLTSLYIGLKGTYAYKLKSKWWSDKEANIPTRSLYLNISEPMQDDNDRQMMYAFQFLTKQEHEKRIEEGSNTWFEVGKILSLSTRNDLDLYIESNNLLNNKFSKDTLRKLHQVIYDDRLINYYLEKTQEIDTVLDIFIRTNSGGIPLSFSDLLMSITTVNWTSDARREIPGVVKKVFEIGNPGFLINKDFVLKTCLVLLSDNIKFQVRNFDKAKVMEFEANWGRIKSSILETFTLLANLGFNNKNLQAKNAAIPIIFYIFHRNIEGTINSPIKFEDDKQQIRKWLCLSIIKGVFGSQSDSILSGIRKVIKSEINDLTKSTSFPFSKIKDEFKGNPTKNLSFDDDFIDELLTTQKDSSECFIILSLMYSHLNFRNQEYHQDHLHPAKYFRSLNELNFNSVEDFTFYKDPGNWNSIANLQLLNGPMNQSKQATPLNEWVNKNTIDRSLQLIPEASLDIVDFKIFILARRELLKSTLKQLVY